MEDKNDPFTNQKTWEKTIKQQNEKRKKYWRMLESFLNKKNGSRNDKQTNN